jgi:PAS domain S-box-containing protein
MNPEDNKRSQNIGKSVPDNIPDEKMRGDEHLPDYRRKHPSFDESEIKYRTLFENMAPGVFYQRNDGSLLDVNPAALKMVGLSHDNFIGKDSYDPGWRVVSETGELLSPEQHPSMIALRTGRPVKDMVIGIFNYEKKEFVWVRANATPQFRPGEVAPYQVFVTMDDITDLRRANESVVESEEKFRELFSRMPAAVAVYEAALDGQDFIFRDFNAAAEAIEGINKKDIIGKRVSQVFPGITEFGLFEVFKRVWATGKAEFFPAAMYRDERDPGTWRENWVYKLSSGMLVAIYTDITSRKQAEEKLRENEERLRQITDNSPAVFYIHDRVLSEFIYVSPAYEKIWGRPCQELYDNPYSFLMAVHPEDLPSVQESIRRELEEGVYFDGEYRIIQPDGRIRWVHSRNFPVKNEQGTVDRVTGIAEDITKRKQAEEKLKESEDRFRKIFENSPVGMALVTPDFRFSSVNPAWVSMTGYSEEELLELSFEDITNRDYLEGDRKHIRELVEKTIPVYCTEKQYIRKDGSILQGSLMLTTIRDQQDALRYFVAQIEDITERRRAEEALIKSEARFRTMVEASPDMIWEVDLHGTFMYISSQSREQLGYPPGDLIGRSFFSILKPESVSTVRDAFLVHIREKCSFTTIEVPAQHKDGTQRIIQIRSVPIIEIDGHLRGFRGVARDITQQKVSEEALKELGAYNRSLIEASLDPLVTISHDGKIQDVNSATEKVTGYSRSELIGTDFSDYFVDPDKAHEGYQEVFDKGIVRDYPLEIRNRGGQITPVLYNAALYHDREGNIRGIFAAARDITELKVTQDALRYSEEKYRDLAELMPQIIFETDLNGQFTYVNRFALNLFGYDSSEFEKGLDISQMVIRDDADRAKRNLAGIVRGDKKSGNEYRFQLKNGNIFTGITYLSVIEKDDRPVGLRGIIVDITERKHNEDILSLSHTLLDCANRTLTLPDLLMDYIHILKDYTGCEAVGLRLLDNEGNIPYQAYHGFSEKFYSTESPLSIRSDECMCIYVIRGDTDPSQPFFTPAGSFYMNGTTKFLATVSEEDKGRTRNVCNQTGYESVALVPIRQGNRIMGLIHLADRRENKVPLVIVQVIEEIADTIGSAIQRISAEKQVRDSLEEKEVLLREIHHRVKNNLARVISLIGLQKAQLSDPNDIAMFRDLESRIRSMSLVHESLYHSHSLSRINAQMYVQDLTQHLIQSYGPRADIRWEIRMGNIVLPIDVAIHCGLIITEICTNSIKYAFPEGWECTKERGEGCRISISMNEKDGFIILNASDNGIGIPPGTITTGPGSLGLTLVRILTKNQLHGDLEMDTTNGTAFVIRFAIEPKTDSETNGA